jgi:zinc transport system substrate-binding protein
MRRLSGVLVAALVATAVPAGPASRPVRILASFYPIYVATLNVAGGIPGVEVGELAPPVTGCLHDYCLTTADLARLSGADVFVVNGAGMEEFLDKVVAQLPRLRVVRASEGIELLPAAGGGAGNPHVWLSVTLHIRQVRTIAEQLGRADPPHAREYAANAAAYVARLEGLRARISDGLAGLRSRDIVTFHEAFPYFAREFGLRVAAVIEREPGSEPSARELAETVAAVRRAGVQALFAEPQYPAKAAAAVARETGARLYVLDPVVSGPESADAYVAAMERNLRELQRALR